MPVPAKGSPATLPGTRSLNLGQLKAAQALLPPTAASPRSPASPPEGVGRTSPREQKPSLQTSRISSAEALKAAIEFRDLAREVEENREGSTLTQRKIVNLVKGVHKATERIEMTLQRLEERDERERMNLAAQNLDITLNAANSQMRALSLIEDLEGRREQIDFLQSSIATHIAARRDAASIVAVEERDGEIKQAETAVQEWVGQVAAALDAKAARENSVVSICSKLSENLKEMYMRATRVVDEGLLHALFKLDVLKYYAISAAMDQDWLYGLKSLQEAIFDAQQEAKRHQLHQDATKDALRRRIDALAARVADPIVLSLLVEQDVPGAERADLQRADLSDTRALEEIAARAPPRAEGADPSFRRRSQAGADSESLEQARSAVERQRRELEEATRRAREAEARYAAREGQLERDFKELQAAAGSQDLLVIRQLQGTVAEWRARWDEAQAEVGAYQLRMDERDAEIARKAEELEAAAERERRLEARLAELRDQVRALEAGVEGDSSAVLARVAAAEQAAAHAYEELDAARQRLTSADLHTTLVRELEAEVVRAASAQPPPSPGPGTEDEGEDGAHSPPHGHHSTLAVPGQEGRPKSGVKGSSKGGQGGRKRSKQGAGAHEKALAPPKAAAERPVSAASSVASAASAVSVAVGGGGGGGEEEEVMESDVDAEPFPTYKRGPGGLLIAMRGVPVQTDDELVEPLLMDRVRAFLLAEDEWKSYTGEPKILAAKYSVGRTSALTLEEKERLRKQRWRATRDEIRLEIVRRHQAAEALHGPISLRAAGGAGAFGAGGFGAAGTPGITTPGGLSLVPATPGASFWRLGGELSSVSSRLTVTSTPRTDPEAAAVVVVPAPASSAAPAEGVTLVLPPLKQRKGGQASGAAAGGAAPGAPASSPPSSSGALAARPTLFTVITEGSEEGLPDSRAASPRAGSAPHGPRTPQQGARRGGPPAPPRPPAHASLSLPGAGRAPSPRRGSAPGLSIPPGVANSKAAEELLSSWREAGGRDALANAAAVGGEIEERAKASLPTPPSRPAPPLTPRPLAQQMLRSLPEFRSSPAAPSPAPPAEPTLQSWGGR
eukprot:tig00020562_g11159.t1